jgi:ribosomal 50S subunit-recycling heat shock protein
MRLDTYLKISRLVPRRSEAGALCREGKVLVDAVPAKAGRTVAVGSRILIRKPGRELTVLVLALPAGKSVSKAQARELYEVTGEKRFDFWGEEILPKGGRAPSRNTAAPEEEDEH